MAAVIVVNAAIGGGVVGPITLNSLRALWLAESFRTHHSYCDWLSHSESTNGAVIGSIILTASLAILVGWSAGGAKRRILGQPEARGNYGPRRRSQKKYPSLASLVYCPSFRVHTP